MPPVIATLVIAAAGAAVIHLIGFPAAALTGPAIVVVAATLLGIRTEDTRAPARYHLSGHRRANRQHDHTRGDRRRDDLADFARDPDGYIDCPITTRFALTMRMICVDQGIPQAIGGMNDGKASPKLGFGCINHSKWAGRSSQPAHVPDQFVGGVVAMICCSELLM